MFFVLGFIFVVFGIVIGIAGMAADASNKIIAKQAIDKEKEQQDQFVDPDLDNVLMRSVYVINSAVREYDRQRMHEYREKFPEFCSAYLCMGKSGEYICPWDYLDVMDEIRWSRSSYKSPFLRTHDIYPELVSLTCGKMPGSHYLALKCSNLSSMQYAPSTVEYVLEHGIPALSTADEYIEEYTKLKMEVNQ